MTLCAVPWCCAIAGKGGKHCPVHRKWPDYKPQDKPAGADPECDECNGSGECSQCNGSGVEECDLGHEHYCSACEGSGECPDCESA